MIKNIRLIKLNRKIIQQIGKTFLNL